MRNNPIFFIAFKGADNHGVGYMCALLQQSGFRTRVLDLMKGKKSILKIIKENNPGIVGFSIIFQSHFKQYIDLVKYLRSEGINCHFTAGGHYASMKYEELLASIPWLNSIVRFEGEYTILELAESIYSGSDWRRINGLVYPLGNRIITNPLRTVETDLDKFPFPVRPRLKKIAFNIKFAAIIAGRGCIHNCSFCNTKEYYRQMSGPRKRSRRPEMVVKEIRYLHERKNCEIFMFDDDDFPVKSNRENGWIVQFCANLKKNGLEKKILWKINCRPDEVDEENFRMMKMNGLFHAFLGIEDGTDTGLKKLNKNTTAEQNLKNIKILKDLGIGFDFGFMLFQPDTIFGSLKDNIRFLKDICGDGYTPVTFLKLLPLYETKVEKELRLAGKLKMIDGRQDYDFPEESMNDYYKFVMICFSEWLTGKNGVVNIAQSACYYFEIYPHFFDAESAIAIYHSGFRKLISESNLFLLDTMEELASVFERKQYISNISILENYARRIKMSHSRFRILMNHTMAELLKNVIASDN